MQDEEEGEEAVSRYQMGSNKKKAKKTKKPKKKQ